jgi:putative flippase GtrA
VSWRAQGMRFAIVGLGSNLALYLLYVLLTGVGLGHKLAMTLLYVLGVTQTFLFNRRWTFSHDGALKSSLWRYAVAYATGYLANLGILLLLVDALGWPHLPVQAAAIVLVAGSLFLAQKHWVFAARPGAGRRGGELA